MPDLVIVVSQRFWGTIQQRCQSGLAVHERQGHHAGRPTFRGYRRAGASGDRARLCRARDGLNALNEVGITERALRFEQVQYLEYQFVYGAIFGGEAEQPLREIKTLL